MGERQDPISIAEATKSLVVSKPHVIILGAGASLAACPNGDRYGRKLPLMSNFTNVVALDDLVPTESRGQNFEEFFSRIAADPNESERTREIEQRVYAYFAALELPNEPTIYDHLVLSLRSKDVVATFNWDPFLLQALRRNESVVKGVEAKLLFLHGNVLEAFCEHDRVVGVNVARCSKCNQFFEASTLLYPVAKKDYSATFSLKANWLELETALRNAFMVTIFGYSAPRTDVDAIALLKTAWSGERKRDYEQIEIIDIRSQSELLENWSEFIYSHHFHVVDDFFKCTSPVEHV